MLMEQELMEIRRANLRLYFAESKISIHQHCVNRGLSKSTESQISQIFQGGVFGDKAARSLERKLGMTLGILEHGTDEVRAAVKTGKTYPPEVESIALLFGMLPDEVARTVALQRASTAILDVLREYREQRQKASLPQDPPPKTPQSESQG